MAPYQADDVSLSTADAKVHVCGGLLVQVRTRTWAGGRWRTRSLAWLESPVLDIPLYSAAAAIALLLSRTSGNVTYRIWGLVSVGVFTIAAFCCLVLVGAVRAAPSALLRGRAVVAGLVLIGVIVVPLVLEVTLRARWGVDYTQDEVLTTERAAESLIQGNSPYRHPLPVDGSEARRFPYLPLMAVFGLPHARWPAIAWTDARVMFSLVTLAVTAFAVVRWRVPAQRRLRVLQLFLLMPTGSLSLVTGGDDLPVMALMLLALVLRTGTPSARSAALSAGAMALAGLMKMTAWPLLVVLMLEPGRAVRQHLSEWLGYLAVPAVLIVVLKSDGPGLLEDNLLFPLGLLDRAPIRNLDRAPAFLDSAAPLLTAAAAATVVLLVVVARGRHDGASKSGHCPTLLAAGLITVALLTISNAARPGLWAYPLNLSLWGLLGLGRRLTSSQTGLTAEE